MFSSSLYGKFHVVNFSNFFSIPVSQKEVKNIFTNDGSFLDQFKQLKDKRLESKIKSFGSSKENSERNYRYK